MPYGQSPWQDAAEGTGAMGSSMARIMMAQQAGRLKAQQFAQQMALRQAQEQVQQGREESQAQETQARIPLINAQTDEAKSVTGKNTQEVERQAKMDELAHAVAVNMFKQRVPGGVPGAMARGGGGPTIAAENELNQGDLVRNAMQLIGMKDPNGLTTMMMGKNIPQGDVNFNPLTQDRVEGLPPRPPTGAPIDPGTGMTSYQSMALALQRARMADQDKRTEAIFEKLHMSPEWQMEHPDDSVTGGDSGGTGTNAPSGSKQLDAQTASKILQQAGGDKEKARALAKQQGYTF